MPTYTEPVVNVEIADGCTNAGANCANQTTSMVGDAGFAVIDDSTLLAASDWTELLQLVEDFQAGSGKYVDTTLWDDTSYPEAFTYFGQNVRRVVLAVNPGEGGTWPRMFSFVGEVISFTPFTERVVEITFNTDGISSKILSDNQAVVDAENAAAANSAVLVDAATWASYIAYLNQQASGLTFTLTDASNHSVSDSFAQPELPGTLAIDTAAVNEAGWMSPDLFTIVGSPARTMTFYATTESELGVSIDPDTGTATVTLAPPNGGPPMATAFAAPPVSVDGPIPLPPEYSLLQQAEVIDGNLREIAGGVGIWGYPSSTGRLWAPCQTGTFSQKDLSDDLDNPSFLPFGVYLPVVCTMIDATEDELTTRARAAFTAVESEAVERELATGLIQPGNPYLGDSNVDIITGTQPAHTALALLERAIGATGRKGVIHGDPAVTTVWAQFLMSDGDELHTIANGTTVISGDGYIGTHPTGTGAPTATQGWAYATGPITIYRSPIEVIFGRDHRVNDQVALAERNYLVTWDVQLQVAVLVDLTA